MKRFAVVMFSLALAACATLQPVSLPQDGFSIEGVDVGDRVKILRKDGQKLDMSIDRIDVLGLHGGNEFCFYTDMQSVSVVETQQMNSAWWLVLGIAAIAVIAEPDSSFSGPFCLRSSEGGPCLP